MRIHFKFNCSLMLVALLVLFCGMGLMESTDTVSEKIPAAPTIEINPESPYLGESSWFRITAAGMTQYEIGYCDQDGSIEWSSVYAEDIDNSGMKTVNEYSSQEEHQYYRVRALVDGKWSEWSDLIILIWQSRGKLDTPAIQVDNSYLAGQDLAFPVTSEILPNTSVRWMLEQYIESNDEWQTIVWYGYISQYDSKRQVSLTSDNIYGLEAGEYRIRIYADGGSSGYQNSEYAVKNFTVTGTRPAAPAVQVVVNNQYASIQNQVNISAAGLEDYVAERKYNDYWSREWSHNGAANGVGVFRTYGDVEDLTRNYRFRGLVNGCWTEYTDEVTLTWKTKGPANTPSVTLPVDLKAGEPAEIVINDGVAGDEYIRLEIFCRENDYDRTINLYPNEFDSEGKALLEEYGLESGTYLVAAIRQKTDYSQSEEFESSFTVAGERPAAPASSLSATSIYMGESVTFTASGTGLELLRFGEWTNDRKDYMANGNRAVAVIKPAWSDTIGWRAKINGRWTEQLYTDHITVNDTEDRQLSSPDPDLDNLIITVGQDFTFPINVDSRTEILTVGIVQVEQDGENEYRWLREVEYEMVVNVVNGKITIPGNRFTSPGMYRFNFNAFAEGYNGGYADGYVVKTNEMNAAASINMNVTLETGTSFIAYQDLPVTISAPGCSKAMLKVIYKEVEADWWSSLEYFDDQITVSNGTAVVTLDALMPGYYTFTARGYDGTGWSDWSEEKTLTVQTVEQQLPYFEINEYPSEVISGEPFTVRWNASDGAEKYRVYYKVSDSDALYGKVIVPATQTYATLTITNRADQQQLDYSGRIWVEAIARGYESNISQDVYFELMDSAKPAVTVSKNNPGRMEEVKLTVKGSKANDLRVKINGAEKGHLVYNAPNGTGEIKMNFSAAGTYKVQVSTCYNWKAVGEEIWSNWSDPVTITVAGWGSGAVLALPDDLVTIETEAFAGVDAVRVIIPDGCTTIGNRAFADCQNLTVVMIPSSVSDISGNPFEGCSSSLVIITPANSEADKFAAAHGYIVERP